MRVFHENILIFYARLYAGHPRLKSLKQKDVDGRDKRAFHARLRKRASTLSLTGYAMPGRDEEPVSSKSPCT
jgi:hypothetical protein